MRHDYPVYDMRDGAEHAHLQLKTLGEFVQGLAWNDYVTHGVGGIIGDHEKHLKDIVRRSKRGTASRVICASLHNYGVSVYLVN